MILGLKNLRTGAPRRRTEPTKGSITQKRKARRAHHSGAMCPEPATCDFLHKQGR